MSTPEMDENARRIRAMEREGARLRKKCRELRIRLHNALDAFRAILVAPHVYHEHWDSDFTLAELAEMNPLGNAGDWEYGDLYDAVDKTREIARAELERAASEDDGTTVTPRTDPLPDCPGDGKCHPCHVAACYTARPPRHRTGCACRSTIRSTPAAPPPTKEN